MSAERDVNRIVRSWIRADEHESADRVLQTVLSRLDTTPQRRSWWASRRFLHVNKYAQAAIAAAAVLVVALIGYNLLPRTGDGVGTRPTLAPTPSPSPIATGTFHSHGGVIQLDATGDGAHVTGRMIYTDEGGEDLGHFVVDLACTRTTDGGLILIGGAVIETTNDYAAQDLAPEGRKFAIVLQRGSPVKAEIYPGALPPDPASCQVFLESIPDLGDPERDKNGLEPIEGTIELRP
jgi:hypothetical protein